MYLGCNTNSSCGKTSAETLTNIKNAGFTHVMVSAKSGDFDQTLREAKELGLIVPYVHLDAATASVLWAKGAVNRSYIESVCNQLRICGKYGVPVAVMHPTDGRASELALPPTKQGIDSMNEILNAAEKHNVKIALENLDGSNFQHFIYLMENIKSERFGFCYDMGHHNLYYPETDIMGKYGHLILAVHLHDNLMDWEFGGDWSYDLHLLPFDGKGNIEKACKQIAQSPYKNVTMLEVNRVNRALAKYEHLTPSEYLKEAYSRAERLDKLIEKYRNA